MGTGAGAEGCDGEEFGKVKAGRIGMALAQQGRECQGPNPDPARGSLSGDGPGGNRYLDWREFPTASQP